MSTPNVNSHNFPGVRREYHSGVAVHQFATGIKISVEALQKKKDLEGLSWMERIELWYLTQRAKTIANN